MSIEDTKYDIFSMYISNRKGSKDVTLKFVIMVITMKIFICNIQSDVGSNPWECF